MTANEMRDQFMLKLDGAMLANRTFNDREISDFLTKGAYSIVKGRYDRLKNRTQRGYPQGIRSDELAGIVTGTDYITNDQMIVGTENNGALPGPDLDAQVDIDGTTVDSYYTSDNFGYFVPIPDEAMYIINEHLHNSKEQADSTVKHLKNVPTREVSYEEHASLIYNNYRKPYKNLAWTMDWGSFTVATYSGGQFDPSTKSYSLSDGTSNMDGTNESGSDVPIKTFRARYIIPGKGWKVEGYRVFYIKTPSEIVVDVQDPSAQQNCDLASFLHEEVVEEAVKVASASLIPEQNKYQVSQNETAEDE